MMAVCTICSRVFCTQQSLRQHQRDSDHTINCPHCLKTFSSAGAVTDHIRSSHSLPCAACARVFPSVELLKKHQRSTGLCFCQSCNRRFSSSQALQDHMKSTIHATQFRCCDCERDFKDQSALEKHLRKKEHHPRRNVSAATPASQKLSLTCHECKKSFQSTSGLRQHKASLVHHPLGNIKCLHRRCTGRFTSPSALLSHLESGACRSGMNRATINSLVIQNDSSGIITRGTLPQNMKVPSVPSLTASSTWSTGMHTPDTSTSSEDDMGPLILTPTSSTASSLTLSRAQQQQRCFLCPKQKNFKTSQALRDHLSSAAHAPKMFYCPTQLIGEAFDANTGHKVNLSRSFSTASGLVQHIESEACCGAREMLKRAVVYFNKNFNISGLDGFGRLDM